MQYSHILSSVLIAYDVSNVGKKRKIVLENGKEITIRYIKFSDLNAIWENYNEVVDEGRYLPAFEHVTSNYEKKTWYQDLIGLGNLCIVAQDKSLDSDEDIVGQCTIEDVQWEASDHVGVLGIIVRKSHRNMDIGYHLIEFSLEEAQENGKEKIILTVFETNKHAISLYQKLGFDTVGVRKKHFFMNGQYIDEILMEKWIGD
ncbi:MAG: GNAT family N-acetyltransferase [Candidatus Lokiarchaeota archaeon]|nr:GNAT family N-acetyltransferase [Candidatus Lokiarchaeota archaeon]